MNELTLDGKTYVSSKRAAEITGYAKDYVGQLCREGRVEARLVGRNWYILESAIREHRFGSEDKAENTPESARSYASSAWEAPRYAAEESTIIPALSERVSVNELSDASRSQNSVSGRESYVEPSTLLTDMQSAWQEWYERKETAQSPEKITESVEEPVQLQRDEAPEAEEIAAEEVVLAAPAPETTLDLSRGHYTNVYEAEEYIEEEPIEEGRIVEETIRKGLVAGTGITISSSLIRSALIAVMLLVVAVTVVGSGLLEQFGGGNTITRSSEIRYLAGVSSYNH